MYYLNSRYYNPEWGRFINADALVGQTGDLLGHNKFTYCLNNPINMLDPSGYKANWLRIGRGLLTMAVGSLAVLAGAAASETGIGVVGAVLGWI